MNTEMTPAVVRAIKALDQADQKRMSLPALRCAAGVLLRAWPSIVDRMERSRLVVLDRAGDEPYAEITFRGLTEARKLPDGNPAIAKDIPHD